MQNMKHLDVRKPYVAGRFYPKEPERLRSYLKEFAQNVSNFPIRPEMVIGGVVPHAGYMFSGQHAMNLIYPLYENQYDTVVIVSPSHTGQGPAVSLDASKAWETPLGTILVDSDLQQSGLFEMSYEAQQFEHSAEVIVPMIQFTFGSQIPIAVITIREQNYRNAIFVANQLNAYKNKTGKNILLLSSTDFNHYETPEIGKEKDDRVLENILSFRTSDVETTVRQHRVTVCGYGPIMTIMQFSRHVDQHPQATVVSRGHSGEIIPSSEVVDYISILFHKS